MYYLRLLIYTFSCPSVQIAKLSVPNECRRVDVISALIPQVSDNFNAVSVSLTSPSDADHSEKQSADLSGVVARLRGLSHVLDALLASIADGASAAQQRLQDLKEVLLKALQVSFCPAWI